MAKKSRKGMAVEKTAAVKNAVKARKHTRWTGLYWACSANSILHMERGFACQIMKGPKSFFMKCGVCRTFVFLGPAFDEHMGMTYEEAEKQGFIPLGDRGILKIKATPAIDDELTPGEAS